MGKRNTAVPPVWLLVAIGALLLAVAITSTGTVSALDRDP